MPFGKDVAFLPVDEVNDFRGSIRLFEGGDAVIGEADEAAGLLIRKSIVDGDIHGHMEVGGVSIVDLVICQIVMHRIGVGIKDDVFLPEFRPDADDSLLTDIRVPGFFKFTEIDFLTGDGEDVADVGIQDVKHGLFYRRSG